MRFRRNEKRCSLLRVQRARSCERRRNQRDRMCGRARCSLRPGDIPRACHLNDGVSVRQIDIDRYRPSHNVSPGSYMPVVRREDGEGNGEGAALHCMKWGLIPSFTKKDEKPDHYRMFNARSESISEKASFRRLIPKNRCLVSVEGFYEWKKEGTKKQPYYIHFKDGRPLVFAALYDSWKNPEEEILYTFTIITTSSSKGLQWLHDRMPVILVDETSTTSWLYGSSSKLDNLLKPYENSDLAWYPVTPEMGKPSFDGPECIKEIPLKKESTPITKFFSKKGTTDDAKVPKPPVESVDQPSKIDLKKELNEEPEAQAHLESVSESVTGSAETEVKPSFAAQSPEPGQKCHAKREFQEFKSDTKSAKLQTNNMHASPAKKKSKRDTENATGNKQQSTLFSFLKKG
ncbi:hypothetical protein V2J09_022045 [Rumex salicifolius]